VAKIEIDAGRLDAGREQLGEAYQRAIETKDMPIVAMVGVAVAMLALASGQPDDAAEILGAAASLRGAEDSTEPDIVRMDAALGGLADGPHAARYALARDLDRDAAIARLNPVTVTPTA
jgi:hypothetical protein